MLSLNRKITTNKRKHFLNDNDFSYYRGNSYLFVNGTEICKFKTKDSAIVASPLCLGNISKE